MIESPRYLFARKKFKELGDVINRIAMVNGSKYRFDASELALFTQILNPDSEDKIKELEKEKEYSVFQDLKNPKVLTNFLIIICCFSVTSFDHYMLTFYLKYIGGNIFVNNIVIGVSAVIANLTASVMQRKWGTKRSLTLNISLALIFGFPLLFQPSAWLIAVC